MNDRRLVDVHVDAFNRGVRSGSFDEMLELFHDDARLVFEGVPAGPFEGRAAIADAYREQPPDDEIDVLGISDGDGGVVVSYAWRADGGKRAGDMIFSIEGGLIKQLVVTFDA
jgi:steroid delta-isomerase